MKVFISYIHEEAQVAQVLKEWVESTFVGQIQVFISSDIKDIPAGSKWLSEIDSALNSSSLFLLLCSKASLVRPWINFEAGCAWIKKVPLIPLCHSGLKKSELPSPLSVFQGLELDVDKFPDDFFESLKIHFGISKLPRIDKNAMRQELYKAIDSLDKNLSTTLAPLVHDVKKISNEDALNIIESWMGSRASSDNKRTIRFSDVDTELHLPEGTTKRIIEKAAIRWDYIVRRKGEDTILFEDAPDPQNRSSYDEASF